MFFIYLVYAVPSFSRSSCSEDLGRLRGMGSLLLSTSTSFLGFPGGRDGAVVMFGRLGRLGAVCGRVRSGGCRILSG